MEKYHLDIKTKKTSVECKLAEDYCNIIVEGPALNSWNNGPATAQYQKNEFNGFGKLKNKELLFGHTQAGLYQNTMLKQLCFCSSVRCGKCTGYISW